MQHLCSRLAILFLLLPLATAIKADHRELQILGWLEEAKLASAEMAIQAKLDTGADNSSLNAPDHERFDRDGEEWIRFTVENRDGDKHTFEKPVERNVRIRSASGTSRRPVVKMELCVGHVLRRVDVNLADRSNLQYQMLIGRSYMKDRILVDSAAEFTADPDCSDAVADDADRPDEGGDYDDEGEQRNGADEDDTAEDDD